MPLANNNVFHLKQYAEMIYTTYAPEESAPAAEHQAYHQRLVTCIRDIINHNIVSILKGKNYWSLPPDLPPQEQTVELTSALLNMTCMGPLSLSRHEYNEARFLLLSQLVAGIGANIHFVPNKAWQQCLIALSKLFNSIPNRTPLQHNINDAQQDRLSDILRRLPIPSIIIFLSAATRVKLSQSAFVNILDTITLAKRDGAPDEQMDALFVEKEALFRRQNDNYDMFVWSFSILMLQGALFGLVIILKHMDKPSLEHGLFRHRIATMPEQLAEEIAAISKRPQP